MAAAAAEKTRRGRHRFSTADSMTFTQVQHISQEIPVAVEAQLLNYKRMHLKATARMSVTFTAALYTAQTSYM